MNPNLYVQRRAVLAFAWSPLKVNVAFPSASVFSGAVALGNNPVFGSGSQAVPGMTAAWPNVSALAYSATPGAPWCRSGFQIFNASGAPLNFTVVRGRMEIGMSASLRSLAGNNFLDCTNLWLGAGGTPVFAMGLQTGDGSAVIPSVPVSKGGLVENSPQISDNIALAPNFPYVQTAQFSGNNSPIGSVPFVDTLISPVLSSYDALNQNLQSLTPDWIGGGGADNEFMFVMTSVVVELGLFIDPKLLSNNQNAASDLYIKLPHSVGVSAARMINGSDYAIPGNLTIGNAQGSYRTTIVPLTRLKRNGASGENVAFGQPANPTLDSANPQNWWISVLPDTTIPSAAQRAAGSYYSEVLADLKPMNGGLVYATPTDFGSSAVVGPI